MVKRTILATLAICALAVAIHAQVNTTVVLRSGEKVTGQLVDMNASGFFVRVNDQDRQIGTGDVAVIDFGGSGDVSDEDLNKVGDRGVLLRSGDGVKGELIDVGGTNPLRLTVRTDSGERNFTSSEVSRIVLARPSSSGSSAGTTGSTPDIPAGNGIAVPANQSWTPTGVTVRKGDQIRFSATGEARLSNDASDVAGVAGSRAQRKSPGAPLPNVFAGALIGRVGTNGEPFPIGDSATVTMPAAGQLFLGINDDHVADNAGGFRVVVSRTGRR